MFPEYSGMTYEQASEEGLRLLRKAAETGYWHGIVGRLSALRDIMKGSSLRQDRIGLGQGQGQEQDGAGQRRMRRTDLSVGNG